MTPPPGAEPSPPALPTRLLRLVLPDGAVGRSIVGDLREEWARGRPGAGRDWSYTGAALLLAARYGAVGLVGTLEGSVSDVRRALRSLLRSPLHLALTVLALGIGVGAPATMYSIVAGLTRELDVEEPERLVHLARRGAGADPSPAPLAWLRPVLRGIDGLEPGSVGLYATRWTDLSGGSTHAERYRMAMVTPGVFRALGRQAAVGRVPTEGDLGGEEVVVLAWDLQESRFGGDADVLGRTVRTDGTPRTVVGVMPRRFGFPGGARLWIPVDPDTPGGPAAAEGRRWEGVARLAGGATVSGLQDRVASLTDGIRAAGVEVPEGDGLVATPLEHDMIAPRHRFMLKMMVLVVSFVLLIACVDVANLLVARALRRGRETAVRVALGAGRWTVVRRHLAEASVVALLGGVVGLLLTAWGTAVFERFTSDFLAWWMEIRLDLPVLLFSAGLAAAAALATGLLPAVQAGRIDVGRALRDGRRGSSGFRIGRLSRALVAGEIALSCALLVVSGLMVRGAVRNLRTDGEFETEAVLTAGYRLRAEVYPSPDDRTRFHRATLEEIGALPGVEAAALTSARPGSLPISRPVEIEGRSYERPQDRPEPHVVRVSPGFVETMGSRILHGRDLRWSDGREPRAVLVNEEFVRTHIPDRAPLGARIRVVPPGEEESAPWSTVVGVVPALGVDVGRDSEGAAVYEAASVPAALGLYLVARVPEGADPFAPVPEVRRSFAERDPHLALFGVETLAQMIARTRRAEAVFAALFLVFGLAGLLLAAVGLYGLLSFTVGDRVRELGIRSALGAGPAGVVWTGLKGGLAQLGAGLVLGLGLAALTAPLLGEALLGSDPRDPEVYSAVVLVLGSAGLAAALGPALRAVRVDVVESLRAE